MAGCGSSGSEPSTSEIDEHVTDADYVAAYCAYVGTCGFGSELGCQLDLPGFYSGSVPSQELRSCTHELRQLDCSNVPSGCDPLDLRDDEYFRSICMRLAQSWCKDADVCGLGTSYSCEQQIQGDACEGAVSFSDQLLECESASMNTPCAAVDLPSECTGVISVQ